MSEAPLEDHALAAVRSREAGGRIIRGGAARGLAYLTGTGLTALAFALLLRHLGVADFGRFSTVIALATIAVGLADIGLQTLSQRLYVSADDAGRAGLIGNVLGIRLVATPVTVAAAVVFAALAGYSAAMVTGTVVVGLGFALVAASTTLWLPLQISLRLKTVAFLEFGRQCTTAIAIVVLVVAGAGLVPFFFGYLAAGAAMLVPTALVARRYLVPPRLSWRSWKPLLVEVAPLAVAIALNTLYLKLLIVMASLLTSEHQTGLFAAASRVTEVLVAVPLFVASSALPLLAHAGEYDEERLAYAVRRIGEVALLMGAAFAVVLVVGAQPIIRAFAGPDYVDAVPVLRIQAFALLGGSLTQAWIYALVAVRAERSLIVANVTALLFAGALGVALIPVADARGASIAAVVGESVMAVAVALALVRARPALRPRATYLLRVAAPLGVGLLALLLPIAPAIAAVLAVVAFAGAAWVAGAIPPEIARALLASTPGR
jgi:O-antigen/teichoic acid export membrane protein